MFAFAGASFCPCCTQLAQASEKSTSGYTYKGQTGPKTWPGVCTIGGLQSPINIPLANYFAKGAANGGSNKRGDITFAYYNQTNANVQNTGHGTMQVNAAPGNTCNIDGRDLDLVQWHFHSPSEHAFDGARKAMEVHLVHKDRQSGTFSVVGVMMEEGEAEPNPALQFALDLAPEESGQSQAAGGRKMYLEQLMPETNGQNHRPYVHYVGSLTTPPCSEEVQWYVFASTIKVPSNQVEQFSEFTEATLGPGEHRNSRPLQPLAGRKLDYELFEGDAIASQGKSGSQQGSEGELHVNSCNISWRTKKVRDGSSSDLDIGECNLRWRTSR